MNGITKAFQTPVILNFNLFYREHALRYVENPVDADSQRGLKRSWKAAASQDETASCSSEPQQKISSAEKGTVPCPKDKLFLRYISNT